MFVSIAYSDFNFILAYIPKEDFGNVREIILTSDVEKIQGLLLFEWVKNSTETSDFPTNTRV